MWFVCLSFFSITAAPGTAEKVKEAEAETEAEAPTGEKEEKTEVEVTGETATEEEAGEKEKEGDNVSETSLWFRARHFYNTLLITFNQSTEYFPIVLFVRNLH